jgi:hypothetical protein
MKTSGGVLFSSGLILVIIWILYQRLRQVPPETEYQQVK